MKIHFTSLSLIVFFFVGCSSPSKTVAPEEALDGSWQLPPLTRVD
jgi:hypothetical protein